MAKQTSEDIRRLRMLIEYFKSLKECVIIGGNDSQGVNTTSFLKKGLLDYLADALTCDDLDPVVINAFSLLLNKTEHLNYLLMRDLTVEQIKQSQVNSAVSAFRKVMRDVGIPQFIGNAANLYGIAYRIEPGDNKIKIGSTLRDAKEPIFIYSCGANDAMRLLCANPFGIKADYKHRNDRPNFNYTLDKARNPLTLVTVIGNIERNFDTILGINPNTDVYSLGLYVPKSLQKSDDADKDMDIFREFILKYNDELRALCERYGITYVDTERFGNDTSDNNFHISSAGHDILANHILALIYENKFGDSRPKLAVPRVEIPGGGIQGVVDDISNDLCIAQKAMQYSFGYEQQVHAGVADEHERERQAYKKILD